MGNAAVLDIPNSLSRPISPFRELGAYEALWAGAKTSFRTIAELFEKRPGAVPSDEGKARARKLVKRLVEDDFTIVSGLAKGIDTKVHQTAVEMGGRTIA